MKRSKALLSALIVASSIATFQPSAQASRGSAAADILQRSGSILRRVIPDRISPSTARQQFESCVRGYRYGANKIPLPTARNLCAHLRR